MGLLKLRSARIAFGFGVVAMLVASGCAQRRAPIMAPQGSPPPRAAEAPWPDVPRPSQTAPGGIAPYERTPQSPRIAQPPTLPAPNPDFAPVPPPKPSNPPAPDIAATPSPDLSQPGTKPEATDDYAGLVGGGNPTADTAPDLGNDGAGPDTGTSPAGASPFSDEEPALIALLVPDSDKRPSVRALADGLAKAASLAAADLNEPRLNLRKYDTGGDPRKAAEAAKSALADGAKLIIGPLFSGSAAAVRPVAQQADVGVIAFTTDESVLGGGLYSIGFLPQTDIERMISYASGRGLTHIAALAPDTPYGRVIYDQSRAAASASGATIVRVQPFKPDFRAMDSTAREFAAFYKDAPKVDAILMATSGQSLQGLASYLSYRKVLPSEVQYMGLGLWDDVETLREPSLRGGWFPGVDPALKADFDGRYQAAYGTEAPAIGLLGYDAVAVAASLLREGRSDPFSAKSIQQAAGFAGMSGLFRFRGDGRNQRALSILEVGPQDFRVIDPAPRQFGRSVTALPNG